MTEADGMFGQNLLLKSGLQNKTRFRKGKSVNDGVEDQDAAQAQERD